MVNNLSKRYFYILQNNNSSVMWCKIFVIAAVIIAVIFSGCTAKQIESVTDKLPIKLAKNVSKNATINTVKDSSPPSQVSFLSIDKDSNWINWSWENPEDRDFDHVIIYIDDKFKTNITAPKNSYNLTGLKYQTQYRIKMTSVDKSGNINLSWINASTVTGAKPLDKIPPDRVWYLEAREIGRDYINWTWENPADRDYSYANIYIDSAFKANVTKKSNSPYSFYKLTKLANGSTHSISIRTVDTSKNINIVPVVDVARTLD